MKENPRERERERCRGGGGERERVCESGDMCRVKWPHCGCKGSFVDI